MSNPPKTSATPTPPRVKSAAAATTKAPATKATSTARRASVSRAKSAPVAIRESTNPESDLKRIRGVRGRGIYNRRMQRGYERWSVPSRLVAWLFRRPELVLALLGKSAPVEVQGRVLNRHIQAMLEVTNKLDGLSLGGGMSEGLGDPVEMRKQFQRAAMIGMPTRTDVHVVGRVIPAEESPKGSSGIPLRVYRRFGTGVVVEPGIGSRPPAIVYFHGGGWVTGDLISHDGSCRLLAAVSGCVVIAVDYRLAPENPFPAALDDALAAYGWVHRHADELGISDYRVGVMGDSAGGNLAAAVALLTRNAATTTAPPVAGAPGVQAPLAQGLIYPALTTRFDSASMRNLAEGFFLTMQSMVDFRGAYLPNKADWELAAASPLLAEDVRGVAPALVITAGFDPLHDDGEAYAAKLKEAGVEVQYRCYDDQIHGFFGLGILDDSLALSTEVCEAMGRLMHRPDPTHTDE